MGLGPLLPSEVKAYRDVMQLDLGPTECGLLFECDRQYRAFAYERDHPEKAGTPENNSLADSLKDLARQKERRAAKIAEAQKEPPHPRRPRKR